MPSQRFRMIAKTHRGFKAGVEGETDLDGWAVVDAADGAEVEWGFDSEQERMSALANRLNGLNDRGQIVRCKVCSKVVTSADPLAFPYCRSCFYVGNAHGDLRAQQIADIAAAFDGATVEVEHTGGGCFWLAIRFADGTYYALTDGEAGLPCDDDGSPVRGGWGYVGRYSDDESSDEYEGVALHYDEAALTDPSVGLHDEQAIRIVKDDIAARAADPLFAVSPTGSELPWGDPQSKDEAVAAAAAGDWLVVWEILSREASLNEACGNATKGEVLATAANRAFAKADNNSKINR